MPNSEILAQDFDYRLASQLVGRRTESATIPSGALRAFYGKHYLSPPLLNQYDVIGDTVPSMVANSK